MHTRSSAGADADFQGLRLLRRLPAFDGEAVTWVSPVGDGKAFSIDAASPPTPSNRRK